MKTSNEIKGFIIERLEARDPLELYFEMFRQLEEDKFNLQHLKGVMSRWRCACREASQEKGWGGLDETFPRSIFCWNAALNAIDKQKEQSFYRSLKDAFGWDVKAIAEGKHCPIAQIIIDTKDGRRYDGDTHERIRDGISIDELGEKTQQQVTAILAIDKMRTWFDALPPEEQASFAKEFPEFVTYEKEG